jgi:CheY-like chemotaxis protein
VLVVADNGPGVPAAIRERIFEPYFTTKPVGAGTGIGLSISRSVIDSHGGRIELGDRPGGGAQFRVVLPYDSSLAETEVAEESRGPAGLSILIVDDEIDVAHSLAEMLQDMGHSTRVLEGSAEALGAIERGRFDAVFVDLRMPGMNGVELRARIAAYDPALAACTVIVTGDTVAGPDTVSRHAGQAGAIVLEKPFTATEVLDAVTRVAALRESERGALAR